jgi:hypothetical protein
MGLFINKGERIMSKLPIDVYDYISEDDMNKEFKEEFGTEKLYIHAKELLEFVKSELEKHPTYKDFDVEILGVSRWEY